MQSPRVKLEFEQLKGEDLNPSWLQFILVAPRVGAIKCPALAEVHRPRGQSRHAAFVTYRDSGNISCIEDGCVTFHAKTTEAAFRRQRAYQFGHNPFTCLPSNGEPW